MRELSELTVQCANQLSISFPTQLPLFQAKPNWEHLAEWISAQPTPMTRQIAQKLADNLQYIPFENFLSQLRKTIDDFHQKSNGAPYILLLGESRPYKLKQGCSDQWIIGLALEHCGLREPVMILTHHTLNAWRINHPDITHVLMLDDASYSGHQKKDVLITLGEELTLSFYIGIPFMTQTAERTLMVQQSHFKELIFLDHAYMPSTWDILTTKEQDYVKAANIAFISDRQTITYFDHRFADYESCFQQIYDGSSLLGGEHIEDLMLLLGYTYIPYKKIFDDQLQLISNPDEYNTIAFNLVVPNDNKNFSGYLIPQIIPPYQLRLEEGKQSLRNAILKGKVGDRSVYPLIDPTIIEALPSALSPDECHVCYETHKIPTAKQLAYDEQLLTEYAKKNALQTAVQDSSVILDSDKSVLTEDDLFKTNDKSVSLPHTPSSLPNSATSVDISKRSPEEHSIPNTLFYHKPSPNNTLPNKAKPSMFCVVL